MAVLVQYAIGNSDLPDVAVVYLVFVYIHHQSIISWEIFLLFNMSGRDCELLLPMDISEDVVSGFWL